MWELRIFLGRDASGRVRHRSVTFRGSESRAKRELARLVSDQDKKASPSVVPLPGWGAQTTNNDAIEGWRRNGWEDLSPNTVRGYEGVWRRHVQGSIGKRRIATLSPYDVEQYLRRLKAHGAGKTTVRLVRALLRRSCRLARKWSGNTLPNPVTDTDLPIWSRKEGPQRVRAPEPTEVLAVLKAARYADESAAALIRLIAATGMRRGEACALRWDDIDINVGLVRVDEGVIGVNGPAGARTPKTRVSVRRVAVDEATLDQLETLRRTRRRLPPSARSLSGQMASSSPLRRVVPDRRTQTSVHRPQRCPPAAQRRDPLSGIETGLGGEVTFRFWLKSAKSRVPEFPPALPEACRR